MLGPQITRGKSVQQGFTRASGGLLVEAADVSARIAEPGGDFGRVRAKTRYTEVRKEPSGAT